LLRLGGLESRGALDAGDVHEHALRVTDSDRIIGQATAGNCLISRVRKWREPKGDSQGQETAAKLRAETDLCSFSVTMMNEYKAS
jgi:hypothetical protein